MFCKNCGTEQKDGAKFCHSCGTATSDADTAIAQQQEASPSTEQGVGEQQLNLQKKEKVIQQTDSEIKLQTQQKPAPTIRKVPQLVECICNHCDQHIKFEKSKAGDMVECPGCGMETELYIPEVSLGKDDNLTPHASSLSKWSLGLGVVSISCLPVFASLPAIICGHMAKSRIKNLPKYYGGKGFATAGLIMGYLSILIPIFAGLSLPALSKAKAKAQRIACVNNLKQIGIATRIYATDNQDRFPWQVPDSQGGTASFAKTKSDVNGLIDINGKPLFDANGWRHMQAMSNELSNPKVVRCPRDGATIPSNTFKIKKGITQEGNIIYFGPNSTSYFIRLEADEAKPNQVLAVCPHHEGQFNVMLSDSTVQQVSWEGLRQYFKDCGEELPVKPPEKYSLSGPMER